MMEGIITIGPLTVRADKLIAIEVSKKLVFLYIDGVAEIVTIGRLKVTPGQIDKAHELMSKYCGGNPPQLVINQVNQDCAHCDAPLHGPVEYPKVVEALTTPDK